MLIKTTFKSSDEQSEKIYIIPPKRVRYLSEISEGIRNYNERCEQQSTLANTLFGLQQTMRVLQGDDTVTVTNIVEEKFNELLLDFDPHHKEIIDEWIKSKLIKMSSMFIRFETKK